MRLPPQIGSVESALVGERNPLVVGQDFAANVVEPSTDPRDDVIVVVPRLGAGEHQREELVQPEARTMQALVFQLRVQLPKREQEQEDGGVHVRRPLQPGRPAH